MSAKLIAGVIEPEAQDKSVRPQDDFYRHANGAWIDEHVIPSDQAADGEFHQLRQNALRQCRELIESCGDSDEERKISILYRAYTDLDAIEKAGTQPLQEHLRLIEQTQRADFETLLGKLGREGLCGWLDVFVDASPDDPETNMLKVYQGGLGLPEKAYYEDESYEEVRGQYRDYIAQIFTLAGFSEEADRAQSVFNFERALAKAHWPIAECRDVAKTHNLLPASQLKELAPDFDWDQWWEASGIAPTTLHVYQPSFIEGAGKVWAQATDEQIRDWLRFHVISAQASQLPEAFRKARFDFYGRKLSGQEEMPPRWKSAVSFVDSAVGFALGKLYVAKHFPPESKKLIDELVEDLLAAYKEAISTLDWMGPLTRERALEKLSLFTPKIAYSDKWRDYSELELSETDSLPQLSQKVAEFYFNREVGRIGKPVDHSEWYMTPQTVNAYYSPSSNEIAFPAAILQAPFFAPDVDAAVNYGAIGAVIGHEIGHGFDDQGARYDGHGALHNWWSKQDEAAFNARTSSLIDQYSQYSPAALDDKFKVDGRLTIGENIGDLGGLGIALRAYKKHLEKESLTLQDAPTIDGLSALERFFYSWARIWRSKKHNELAIQLLATDPHSPDEFRCNGVLQNLDEFADCFHVQPGDGMWRDPADRIRIWS